MLKVNPVARVDTAPGFRRMFRAGHLTLGIFFPIEAFKGDEPSMHNQEQPRLQGGARLPAALSRRMAAPHRP